MTRRSSAPAEDAPDITNTAPGDMPGVPAGVEADVSVRYKARVTDKPRDLVDAADELNRLALAHDDAEAPVDPFTDFLETWANYTGYSCMIVRLPDSSTRRAPGATYNRPHFGQPETLGAITFDPNPINFVGALQVINGNSGGSFQLQLMDHNGTRIPGAILYSTTVGDPARVAAAPVQAMQVQPAPQPAQKSEGEKQVEDAKNMLFQTALSNALRPPAAPATSNGFSPEDNAKLFLLGNTNFLDGIFGNMAELAKKAASVAEPSAPTLKDRALDAAVQLVTTNPAIVDRLSGVAERIFARLLPDPRYDPQPLPPPGYYPAPAPPWQQPTQQPPPPPASQPADVADLPETPDEDDEIAEDDETVDILDDLLTLLNSTDPLSLDPPPPVIAHLIKDYPIKARMALRLIASQPLEDIVDWIKDTGGKPYVSLLDGASGPYLRQRLGEFKQACEDAQKKVKAKEQETAPAPAPTPAPETPQQ